MIHKIIVASLLSVVSVFTPVTATAQQLSNNTASSSNGCYPITNASFERFANSTFSNWNSSSWGGSQAAYTQHKPGYNSANAAKISMLAHAPGTSAKLRSESVAVPSNNNLSLSVHARGSASVVQVQVVQLNSNQAPIAYTWLNSAALDNNAASWKQFKNSFYTLAETRFLQIEVLLKSLGTVYIDEVRLGSSAGIERCTSQTQTSTTAPANSPSATGATRSPYSLSQQELEQGLVFSRTDKSEYRWVQATGGSRVGNRWISEACARQLQATTVRGRWKDLNAIAPLFDSIANPCEQANEGNGSQSANNNSVSNSALRAEIRLTPNGYVFHRTDKRESRWVDVTSSGVYGSQWISEVCARRLGAVQQIYGSWSDLNKLAPSSMSVRAPC